jgi:hypothetical protein
MAAGGRSTYPEVFGGLFAAVGHNLVAHFRAFPQIVQASPFDGRDVHEHILAAGAGDIRVWTRSRGCSSPPSTRRAIAARIVSDVAGEVRVVAMLTAELAAIDRNARFSTTDYGLNTLMIQTEATLPMMDWPPSWTWTCSTETVDPYQDLPSGMQMAVAH